MKRKRWHAEEKQKIVMAGLRKEMSVADLCRHYGISDVMYYKWRKKFLQSSLQGLKDKRRKCNCNTE